MQQVVAQIRARLICILLGQSEHNLNDCEAAFVDQYKALVNPGKLEQLLMRRGNSSYKRENDAEPNIMLKYDSDSGNFEPIGSSTDGKLGTMEDLGYSEDDDRLERAILATRRKATAATKRETGTVMRKTRESKVSKIRQVASEQ